MSYLDSRNAEHLMDIRTQGILHRTQTRSLLRQAGLEQRGWLSRKNHWLLCQLGHLLVALGRRLERYEQQQSLAIDGRVLAG